MGTLNRRLRHLEINIQGRDGLIPYTSAWLDHYLDVLDRRIAGEELPPGTKIPLEFFHACRLHKDGEHDELARLARDTVVLPHKGYRSR